MLVITCSGCSKRLQVKEELAGKRAKCPRCGTALAIPSTATAFPRGQATLRAEPEPPPAVPPSSSHELTGGSSAAPDRDTLSISPSGPSRRRPGPKGEKEGAAAEESFDFLAPPQQQGELGRLGPYRVLKVLGSGGMGVVFQAEDPHLERHIGLKAMKPALAGSEAARKRFIREAKATAAIKHDHIVTIFQVGEERGVPFLAMEFLEGEPLDDRLKREHVLPLSETLRIGREIAEGLAAAHERGLIHRDIKPGNIWLERKRGRVKILDFGLARALDDDTHLTQTGAIVGTPAYMAPEQAQGEAVDARCDLFSLGGVLYRMCTGRPPFKGLDTMSLLMSLAMDVPPKPQELNAKVPSALSDLIMKLLAKERDQRPASAHEVAAAIQTIESDPTMVLIDTEGVVSAKRMAPAAPATQPRDKRRRPLPWVAAVLLLGAILVMGVTITFRTKHGTLVLTVQEPDVKVFVDGVEKVVVDSKRVGPIELIPGEHKVLVKRGGEELFTDSFTLRSGGEVVIEAKWTAKVAPDAKTEKTPATTALINVAALRAEEQVKAVAAKLKELNPGFNGKVNHKIEDGVVTSLDFVTDQVTDITPVRTLAGLTALGCNGSAPGKGKLVDLSPLKGMKLTSLTCNDTRVFDLSPLGGMRLQFVELAGTPVADLSPLRNMRPQRLNCDRTHVYDLSPLKNMKLTELRCGLSKVSDLAPLQDMKLNSLFCNNTPISSLAPLKDMKLAILNCGGTMVDDLAPLKDMKLKYLWCNYTLVSDLAPLQNMQLLTLNCARTNVADLTPLKDMKLTIFMCPYTPVSDLSPLRNMKLKRLGCEQTKVADLSVARGMPLELITCDFKAERDAALLRSIKTLETINAKPAAEFWRELDAKNTKK